MSIQGWRGRGVLGRFSALIAGILLLVVSLAQAQSTGAISGRVIDSSGAAIPDANITVTSQETGRVQTTQSSNSGYYKLILPVGAYEVKVEAPSFSSEIRTGLQLAVGQEAVVNLTLKVGSVQETVTVTADAPLIDTTSGTLGGLVNEQKVSDL